MPKSCSLLTNLILCPFQHTVACNDRDSYHMIWASCSQPSLRMSQLGWVDRFCPIAGRLEHEQFSVGPGITRFAYVGMPELASRHGLCTFEWRMVWTSHKEEPSCRSEMINLEKKIGQANGKQKVEITMSSISEMPKMDRSLRRWIHKHHEEHVTERRMTERDLRKWI